MTKILVVTLSNLGDVVLTFPVFEALACAFPKARIDAAVGAGAAAALEGHPAISEVIRLDKKISLSGKIDRILSVRRQRYDLIVDLRYSPIGLLGGAKVRNSYFKIRPRVRHQTLKHLQALEGIVDPGKSYGSFLERRAFSDESLVETIEPASKIITAAVGSKSTIKKWPAESYAALLDRLALNDGCRIVFVGDSGDREDAAKIRGLMRFKGPTDLCGRTDFSALCSVLKKSALVITNDSAPLHIADALKVPVLAFFGPTDPRKYGPRHPASAALKKSLFCSPCEKAQCRYAHECMTQLGVDEAYRKALQILRDCHSAPKLKVLVIRLDRIGDAILSLPAISAIRDRFPDAWISMMVRPPLRDLLDGHPLIDEVIPYEYQTGGSHRFPQGYRRFLKEIVSRHFDAAFILHPGIRSELIPYLAGIPYRVGFDSGRSFLLTHKAKDHRKDGNKHESEYALDVVRAFASGNLRAQKPALSVDAQTAERVSEKIKNAFGGELPKKLIAFHAGASCPSKRWPSERFAELGLRVARETGAGIIFLGGKEEKDLSEDLARQIGSRAVSLAGVLSLKESAAAAAQCGVLVSNDSGPVHMAAAAGARTVVIFGRNKAGLSPARWKPLGEGHRWIQKDVGCQVCLAHRCPIEFECLKAVSVDEVFALI